MFQEIKKEIESFGFTVVSDDYRYAIDSSKINKELGWKPSLKFEEGIEKTVAWYLNNKEWLERIITRKY